MTTPNVSSATPTLTDALLLALISMMGPFAANTYIPAFPDMMRTFGVSENVISQSLSVYLLCFAVGSLFVGTLSDTFGRRRIVVAGALGFCVAAIGAVKSELGARYAVAVFAFQVAVAWIVAFVVHSAGILLGLA